MQKKYLPKSKQMISCLTQAISPDFRVHPGVADFSLTWLLAPWSQPPSFASIPSQSPCSPAVLTRMIPFPCRRDDSGSSRFQGALVKVSGLLTLPAFLCTLTRRCQSPALACAHPQRGPVCPTGFPLACKSW